MSTTFEITAYKAPTITLSALKPVRRWVAWRSDPDNDKPGEYRKCPYKPNGTGQAKSNDPSTWGTAEEAHRRLKNLPEIDGKPNGVGLILGDVGGICIGGIDLDTCRSEDSTLAPWAQTVVDRFATYTEVSPSKTGVKLFFQYEASDLAGVQSMLGGTDKKGGQWKEPGGKHPAAIELYLAGRYFAVTAKRLEDCPEAFRLVTPEDFEWLISHAKATFPANQSGGSPGGGRDQSRSGAAFRKGLAFKRSGATFEEMCEALAADPETAEWTAQEGEPNGQRGLKRIWDNGEAGGVDTTDADKQVEKLNQTYAFALVRATDRIAGRNVSGR